MTSDDSQFNAAVTVADENSSVSTDRKLRGAVGQRVMLLVLGAHRTGTSLTARLLECLGAQNSTTLFPADEFNPKGYFEDWNIYQFNELKLLPTLGVSWHSIGPIDWQRADTHYGFRCLPLPESK